VNPSPDCDPHSVGAPVPHFAPIDLPGTTMPDDLDCAPLTGSANCNPNEVDLTTDSVQPRDLSVGLEQFRTYMEDASGPDVRIVPVYSNFDSVADTYDVIGWAAVSWTVHPKDDLSLPGSDPNRFEIDVSFHKLFVDSTRLTGPGVPAAEYDFGVEALGLTGCKSIPDGCGG
jgi:hypothetical protein